MKKHMIFTASLLTALLAGCDNSITAPATATVVDVYFDDAPMGCTGTNWNTIVKTEDNHFSRLCGKFGQPGDKIAGCVRTGHWDAVRNGFHRDC
ncbi:MAG: hypothetical protein ACYC36_03630 [Bellilinea sp.]